MRILSHKEFTWDGMDLMFQERVIASLVPHESIPNHYHIKFEWRDEKSPEFFNIFNARENARVYSRRNTQQRLNEAH